MLKLPIYLDNHATTRPDPRVVDAMMPYLTEHYGNAGSVSHRFGWEAAEGVETARKQVADGIGGEPREIVFTSGATEANNLAIKGVLPQVAKKGKHIVTTAVEHRAVLDVVDRVARSGEGYEVTILSPDETGLVATDAIAAAIRPDTVLVSVIAANNEIGTIHPIREIAELCRSRGVLFHTDATQAVGKIPIEVETDGIHLMSLSGHKIYGPKGIGALYVRSSDARIRLSPLLDGGGQERRMRSGTLPVPLIAALGKAVELAVAERETETARLRALRDRLHRGIVERLDDVRLNGHPTQRLPNNLNLSFAYVDGEALMLSMKEVAVSSGSACTSADPEPSHVLREIGLDDDLARASLRFGLGRFTTEEEIDYAIEAVTSAVNTLRQYSAIWRAGQSKIGNE